MRIVICFILSSLLAVSCQNDISITESLVGDWNYERETSETFLFLLDFDKEGTMSFRSDKTGIWKDAEGAYDYNILWSFDEISNTIEITKIPNGQGQIESEIKIFDVEKMNEDTFKLIYQKKEQTLSNPPVFFFHSVNIYLTRMK